jgi:DNA invertase Pin-like site-specific DNA recombinase
LSRAIRRCVDGEAEVLVVAKLDRLARSTIDAVTIMERAVKRGWKLVAIDMGLDMTSPMGQFFATMMAAFAQWERALISERTKKAMEQARLMGKAIGAPRAVPEDFRLALHTMSEGGMSDTAIARELNGQGFPHPRTGLPTWTRKDVWSLRRRQSLLVAPEAA